MLSLDNNNFSKDYIDKLIKYLNSESIKVSVFGEFNQDAVIIFLA